MDYQKQSQKLLKRVLCSQKARQRQDRSRAGNISSSMQSLYLAFQLSFEIWVLSMVIFMGVAPEGGRRGMRSPPAKNSGETPSPESAIFEENFLNIYLFRFSCISKLKCAKSEEESEFGGSCFDSPSSVPTSQNFVVTPLLICISGKRLQSICKFRRFPIINGCL